MKKLLMTSAKTSQINTGDALMLSLVLLEIIYEITAGVAISDLPQLLHKLYTPK